MAVSSKMRFLKPISLIFLILIALTAGWIFWQIERITPDLSGQFSIKGLSAPVQITFDDFAVPNIHADNRQDAFMAMGYVTARERLFQMDLMRRKTAGRLAEIFGEKALPHDQFQRGLLMRQAAEHAVNNLPESQRSALTAYVAGINAYMQDAISLPVEFHVLGYQPEPWTLTDSMLVALEMFQMLNYREEVERTITVMSAALPDEVTRFLTPDDDMWSKPMVGGTGARRPALPTPAEKLSQIIHADDTALASNDWIVFSPITIGSNHWAVSGAKTQDGRAILANDMHLKLRVPNTWFQVRLDYGDLKMAGVSLPGLPLIAAGTNGHLAWGFTNALSDVVDLVTLSANPENPDEYRTSDGYRAYETITETIPVKNAPDRTLTVRTTQWGPVLQQPLLDNQVALSWTAIKGDAIDLSLMDMDKVTELNGGLNLMNQAALPPMNAMLADDQGHISWTLTGRYPRRVGFDGVTSMNWATTPAHWEGYIAPEELPRVVDPAEGFLVNANNRTIGSHYPFQLGHDHTMGYRAYRIAQRLSTNAKLTEQDLLDIQLDTTSDFYLFYQQEGLNAIPANTTDPLLREVRNTLEKWDGKASKDSIGFGLLEAFRKNLIRRTLAPYLQVCRQRDPSFTYGWLKSDIPVRQLLKDKIPSTLPEPTFSSWPDYIADVLQETAVTLQDQYPDTLLTQLPWGEENELILAHPFSQVVPWFSWLLDMPQKPLDGCSYCVRVVSPRNGASERLVLSPNHPEDGILHMPGGQSGNPFSSHYRDQQPYWQQGTPIPFQSIAVKNELRLLPSDTKE